MPTPEKSLNGRSALNLYEPINVLKPVAPDLWIVDGPPIEYDLGPLKFPFSTRMTVLRLRNGDLVLHSPVALTPASRSAVDLLGPVRFLIAPNSLHYWWVPDWKAAIPDAEVLAVRGLQKRAKRPIVVDRLLVGGTRRGPAKSIFWLCAAMYSPKLFCSIVPHDL